MFLTSAFVYGMHKLKEHRINKKIKSLGTWRKYVLIRDNYQCDICEKKSKRNQAHHLYSKEHYPKKQFKISNGITLCPKHHRDFHRWNGGTRKRCTPRDYERYKQKSDYQFVKNFRYTVVIVTLGLAAWKILQGLS